MHFRSMERPAYVVRDGATSQAVPRAGNEDVTEPARRLAGLRGAP